MRWCGKILYSKTGQRLQYNTKQKGCDLLAGSYSVCVGERRGVYRILVRKSERMRPLGRPRRKWNGNIKMDLQEMGCEDMDWIDLAQDRDRRRAFVNAVMKLRVP